MIYIMMYANKVMLEVFDFEIIMIEKQKQKLRKRNMTSTRLMISY